MADVNSSPRLCHSPRAKIQLERCSSNAVASCEPSPPPGYDSGCQKGFCSEETLDIDAIGQICGVQPEAEEEAEHNYCSEEHGVCFCDGMRYPLNGLALRAPKKLMFTTFRKMYDEVCGIHP